MPPSGGIFFAALTHPSHRARDIGSDRPQGSCHGQHVCDVGCRTDRRIENLTPLIDVLLVVPVIFMVSNPALERQLPMQLPVAHHGVARTPPRDVQLRIGLAGDCMLDGMPVDRNALATQLQQQRHDDPRLVISSAHGSEYRAFVMAMAAAREAGMANIATVASP
ncbi:MAG: hypothetical protein DI635_09055 [Pseudoxanthomonas suwonensis]|nr:MAG: hypothetical protein DI635_09055 [Pseudoxanthomonas suwonensis]